MAVKVHGIRELHRDLKKYDKDVSREFDQELRVAGTLVAESARSRFIGIDARSATGFKSKTRGFGRVIVEQSRRKTTGLRPDFGSLQMTRALLPALRENEDQIEAHVERMLERFRREHGFA